MQKQNTWWLLNLTGILFIAIGIYCFVNPANAYVKLVKYSGFALLVNGFLLVAVSFLHTSSRTSWIRERKWMHAESILEFIFGILLVFNPLLSFIVFPFLIGYCIVGIGVLKIAASISLKNDIRGWTFIVIIGFLLCVSGALIVYYPFARVNDVTLLIGGFALIMGALTLFDSFRLRKSKDALNMML